MYTEIPSLTRCCFFAPLRYGLIVWAYLKLVFNMLILCCGLLVFSEFTIFLFLSDHPIQILILEISVILLIVDDLIFSIVLVVGIHKKHTTLLRLFFRFGIAHGVLFVTVCLMIIAFLLFTTPEIHRDGTLRFIAVLLTICSSFTILQTYLLLLVRSEILMLKTNGQFQFVNHTSDPKCTMQANSSLINKGKEIPS